jgi:hypothetical protein
MTSRLPSAICGPYYRKLLSGPTLDSQMGRDCYVLELSNALQHSGKLPVYFQGKNSNRVTTTGGGLRYWWSDERMKTFPRFPRHSLMPTLMCAIFPVSQS